MHIRKNNRWAGLENKDALLGETSADYMSKRRVPATLGQQGIMPHLKPGSFLRYNAPEKRMA
jgi:hypothetical protein